jgi:exonuclease VII small subunit
MQGNWQSDAADLLVATSLGRLDAETQVRIYARGIVILNVLNQNLAQLEEKLASITKEERPK